MNKMNYELLIPLNSIHAGEIILELWKNKYKQNRRIRYAIEVII